MNSRGNGLTWSNQGGQRLDVAGQCCVVIVATEGLRRSLQDFARPRESAGLAQLSHSLSAQGTSMGADFCNPGPNWWIHPRRLGRPSHAQQERCTGRVWVGHLFSSVGGGLYGAVQGYHSSKHALTTQSLFRLWLVAWTSQWKDLPECRNCTSLCGLRSKLPRFRR